MSDVLGNIVLPPTPKLGAQDLAQYQQNVSLWTRQAEQTVRQIERFLKNLDLGPSLPNGGTTNQVLSKNSSTNGDASWRTVHELTAGGSTGQVLTKNSSTDYDASWISPSVGVPAGGTTNQVLSKNSSTNYDESWRTVEEIPSGGTTNQVLSKNSSTDFDVSWKTVAASTDVLMVQVFS